MKVKLNRQGVQALLKSKEMQAICMEHASKIKNSAGVGYEVQTRHYPERCGAVVNAVTPEARRDNAKNNTLLKAVK